MATSIRFTLGIAAAVLVGVLIFSYLQSTSSSAASQKVSIGGEEVSVSIADTDATREKGLGGRSGLGDREGMLFVFPKEGYYAFWMKDMSFSIDMVWISQGGTVVYIEPDVSPSTFPTAYRPTKPALYVLELPAGFTERSGVKIGDKVTLPSSL